MRHFDKISILSFGQYMAPPKMKRRGGVTQNANARKSILGHICSYYLTPYGNYEDALAGKKLPSQLPEKTKRHLPFWLQHKDYASSVCTYEGKKWTRTYMRNKNIWEQLLKVSMWQRSIQFRIKYLNKVLQPLGIQLMKTKSKKEQVKKVTKATWTHVGDENEAILLNDGSIILDNTWRIVAIAKGKIEITKAKTMNFSWKCVVPKKSNHQ